MESVAEHRLIGREFGGSFDSYGAEWWDRFRNDYVYLPKDKQNLVDGTTHALGGAASVLTEVTDVVFEKVARSIDGKVKPVNRLEGYFARTRRSLGDLVNEPGLASTVATVFRAPGDVGMDLVDGAIGNTHERN